MKKAGFTGTSRGMNQLQKSNLQEFLANLLNNYGTVEFHHGWCIGADDEAAAIAFDLGCYVIAHPGYPKDKPDDTKFRALGSYNDEILEAKEFIKRDYDIVNSTDFLIAAPHTDKELVRSGTWTTVRYALKKAHKSVCFCWPNRRMETRLPVS
jgi:hypothetical protein